MAFLCMFYKPPVYVCSKLHLSISLFNCIPWLPSTAHISASYARHNSRGHCCHRTKVMQPSPLDLAWPVKPFSSWLALIYLSRFASFRLSSSYTQRLCTMNCLFLTAPGSNAVTSQTRLVCTGCRCHLIHHFHSVFQFESPPLWRFLYRGE